MHTPKIYILMLVVVSVFGYSAERVLAQQESTSVLHVPLIGITSVPEPLALPSGAGSVLYKYAVKNFLAEVALTDVKVVDDTCSPITFVEGDDNMDGKLGFSETWRYSCNMQLSQTTESIATATGYANNILATHKAYATVIIGSDELPPLVSIVNITKVAYPLSLPAEGGPITFTYRVNNPGVVPLSEVVVSDDKCNTMSGRLGDTNGNSLLDVSEVWIYSCTTHLQQTTTNTVTATAFANGLRAIGSATITVEVDTPDFPEVGTVPEFPDQYPRSAPAFPETGSGLNLKVIVWAFLVGVLMTLGIFLAATWKSKRGKKA
ncbi:MAG: hypothetical protein NUV59_02230 [Patescibacteria group bacterium]|nr:hypothetical protein [Patescibacteria group bacterium]